MQDWLQQSLSSYKNQQKAFADIESATRHYPSLLVGCENYTFDNGVCATLVCLIGTIPVFYRSSKYNIPIRMWIPKNYPVDVPLVYVEPTPTMVIRPSSWVEPTGQVHGPFQRSWGYSLPESQMTLVCFIESLVELFGNEPPLYAKPSTSPSMGQYIPQTSSYQAGATISPFPAVSSAGNSSSAVAVHFPGSAVPHYASQQPMIPPPIGTAAAPAPYAYHPVSHGYASGPSGSYYGPMQTMGQFQSPPLPPPSSCSSALSSGPQGLSPSYAPSTAGSYYPRPGTNYMAVPHSDVGAHAPSPPPLPSSARPLLERENELGTNSELLEGTRVLSLRTALVEKINSNVEIVTKELIRETQKIADKKEQLEKHKKEIQSYLRSAKDEQLQIKTETEHYQLKIEEIQNFLKKSSDLENLSPDDYVDAKHPAHRQAFDLVADINALEDTIYQLSRALYQEKIDMPQFLKCVRTLAREIFIKKALVRKIRAQTDAHKHELSTRV